MRTFIVSLALLVLGTVGAFADCTGQFPAGYVCGNDAAAQASPHAIPAPPPKAGSNLTFAVATTGNDANPCTTLLPCLTIQRGVNAAVAFDYQNLYFPTINVGPGTFALATTPIFFPQLINIGANFGLLIGDLTTPSNVIVSTTGGTTVFQSEGIGSTWTIGGFETDTAGAVFNCQNFCNWVTENIIFNDSTHSGNMNPYLAAGYSSIYDNGSTYSILPPGISGLVSALAWSGVTINGTYTLPVGMTDSGFLNVAGYSQTQVTGATFVNGASVVGPQYAVGNRAFVQGDQLPAALVPGNSFGTFDASSSYLELSTGTIDIFAQQISGAPTTSTIDPGAWGIFKDTTQTAGQGISAYVNDAGAMVAIGKLGDATGSTTVAGFGTNSPAITGTAPYTWLKFLSSDGSTVWVPAYK
jgi:hypothetical protein